MDFQKQNSNTIHNAFRGMFSRLNTNIEAVMKPVLHAAVLDALAAHESHDWGTYRNGKPKHPMHTILGDTYGWLLVHNGVEVDREIFYNQRNDAGRADLAISNILHELPKDGWIGVVVASMEPARYYSVKLERDFLTMSAEEAKKRFVSLIEQQYAQSK